MTESPIQAIYLRESMFDILIPRHQAMSSPPYLSSILPLRPLPPYQTGGYKHSHSSQVVFVLCYLGNCLVRELRHESALRNGTSVEDWRSLVTLSDLSRMTLLRDSYRQQAFGAGQSALPPRWPRTPSRRATRTHAKPEISFCSQGNQSCQSQQNTFQDPSLGHFADPDYQYHAGGM